MLNKTDLGALSDWLVFHINYACYQEVGADASEQRAIIEFIPKQFHTIDLDIKIARYRLVKVDNLKDNVTGSKRKLWSHFENKYELRDQMKRKWWKFW